MPNYEQKLQLSSDKTNLIKRVNNIEVIKENLFKIVYWISKHFFTVQIKFW